MNVAKKLNIVSTYVVQLYMAGNIDDAKRLLRQECYPPNAGLCVTIEPTTFIYAGGEENGFVVGFANYPRFPSEPEILYTRAKAIALRLIPALCQWTAMLVAPNQTEWITVKPRPAL
jgi:hypothetical protein